MHIASGLGKAVIPSTKLKLPSEKHFQASKIFLQYLFSFVVKNKCPSNLQRSRCSLPGPNGINF